MRRGPLVPDDPYQTKALAGGWNGTDAMAATRQPDPRGVRRDGRHRRDELRCGQTLRPGAGSVFWRRSSFRVGGRSALCARCFQTDPVAYAWAAQGHTSLWPSRFWRFLRVRIRRPAHSFVWGGGGADGRGTAHYVVSRGGARRRALQGARRGRRGDCHSLATNAVAMGFGGVLLLAMSLIFGEHWVLPSALATWASLIYLIVVGSIALFWLFLFTIKRWAASRVSYMFVLTPIVASLAGAALAGDAVTPAMVAGGVIVLAGVYVGALSTPKARKAVPIVREEAAVA
ncbi:MAG: DMT family transporter [Chloroflexi bacterium]|nr:MAG: DMT family transporter [Chloroflexota bacterium]